MAKKRRKKRRSTTEKVVIILGIVIALSMILSLIVGLGGRRRSSGQAPLPLDNYYYESATTSYDYSLAGSYWQPTAAAGDFFYRGGS